MTPAVDRLAAYDRRRERPTQAAQLTCDKDVRNARRHIQQVTSGTQKSQVNITMSTCEKNINAHRPRRQQIYQYSGLGRNRKDSLWRQQQDQTCF